MSFRNDNFLSNKNILKFLYNVFICALIVVLGYYRIKINNSIMIDFDTSSKAGFDFGYFLENALNFDKFDASVPYALIKNRSFMWYLVMLHKLKISPQIGTAILWIICALLIFLLVKKLTKSNILSIFFYTYVLYFPVAFHYFGLVHFYRNIIFVQFALITITLQILLFLNLEENHKSIKNAIIPIFCGLSLIIIYFASETGVMNLLVSMFLFFVYFVYLFIKYKKINIKLTCKKIFISSIPLIIFAIGVFSYKYINYRTYGVFDINMRTTGEIGRFISNIQDIKSDDQTKKIWATVEQLNKAYQVSDTFKENKKIYEELIDPTFDVTFENGIGYGGDFLGWGIVTGLNSFNINYPEAKKIFKNINDELEKAFKDGRLEKTDRIKLSGTLGRYSIDDISFISVIASQIMNDYIDFKELNFMDSIQVFGESIDSKRVFFDYFNLDENFLYTNYYELIVYISNIYTVINKILLAFTILIMLVLIYINLKNLLLYLFGEKEEYNFVTNSNVYLVLSISFLMMFVLYSFMIAAFSIWMHSDTGRIHFHQYYYGAQEFVFLCLSFIFGICSLIYYLKGKIKHIHINTEKRSFSIIYTICSIAIVFLFWFCHNEFNIINQNSIFKVIQDMEEETRKRHAYETAFYKLIDDNAALIEKHKFNYKNIKENIKYNEDLLDHMSLIGDSYSGYFNNYLLLNVNKKLPIMAIAGKTLRHNLEYYKSILENDKEIILYSTSVNDHLNQSDIIQFMGDVRDFYDLAYKNNKIVITHSYMDYIIDHTYHRDYFIRNKFYDYVLKELSKKYDNVIYVDTNDIKMSSNLMKDGIHYDQNYYAIVFRRMLDTLSKKLDLK